MHKVDWLILWLCAISFLVSGNTTVAGEESKDPSRAAHYDQEGSELSRSDSSSLGLLFWDSKDVTDSFGKLVFGAEALRREGHAQGLPSIQYGCELPQGGGTVWIYGWRIVSGHTAERTIEIVRCSTSDGVAFKDVETVFSYVNPKWQGFANIVYRPIDEALFLFSWSAGELYVFRSLDGKNWQLLTRNAYTDHDAMCVIWYDPWKEFLNYQHTLQPFPKRYPDNIGNFRRVMSFRRSADGVRWQPFSPEFLRNETLLTPDRDDPLDLEFYRPVVFSFQNRYVMLLLDYLAPPPEANSRRAFTKHGPRSSAEWVISRDGLDWERPYREIDATENICWMPVQGPLIRSGKLRFYSPDGEIARLPDDRLFYVTCRANGEFSTELFTMPATGLCLNANVLYRPCEQIEGKFARETGRAYVMVEVRDENNSVISGFERGKCVFANQDGYALPLRWDGVDATALAGRSVRLRFYLRDAKIYGVSITGPEEQLHGR